MNLLLIQSHTWLNLDNVHYIHKCSQNLNYTLFNEANAYFTHLIQNNSVHTHNAFTNVHKFVVPIFPLTPVYAL